MSDNGLLNLLSRLVTVKITQWAESHNMTITDDDRKPASILQGANCASSLLEEAPGVRGKQHVIALDLDVPAYLVPSSTPGHSHLYVDKAIPEDVYYELLDVLKKAEILEAGYVDNGKRHGGTTLRLPWVKKDMPATVAPDPATPILKDTPF